jgi:hypothetical protein
VRHLQHSCHHCNAPCNNVFTWTFHASIHMDSSADRGHINWCFIINPPPSWLVVPFDLGGDFNYLYLRRCQRLVELLPHLSGFRGCAHVWAVLRYTCCASVRQQMLTERPCSSGGLSLWAINNNVRKTEILLIVIWCMIVSQECYEVYFYSHFHTHMCDFFRSKDSTNVQ